MNEEWRNITGYEGYYQVSNLGRIKSMARKIVRTDGVEANYVEKYKIGSKNDDGYVIVKLNKLAIQKSFSIHKLVATEFINKQESLERLEVNHKDLNRENNSVENLEWVTHLENISHSANLGSYKGKDGENNGRAVYSNEDVFRIRELYDNGESIMNIVKLFYPTLDYKTRKNKWSRIKEIVDRKTFKNI